MYTYTMHRTQIYLSEEQSETLARIAAREGRTMSQLVRDAVDRTYVTATGRESVLDVLTRTKGTWKGDRVTGKAHVEGLRSGARLGRSRR